MKLLPLAIALLLCTSCHRDDDFDGPIPACVQAIISAVDEEAAGSYVRVDALRLDGEDYFRFSPSTTAIAADLPVPVMTASCQLECYTDGFVGGPFCGEEFVDAAWEEVWAR